MSTSISKTTDSPSATKTILLAGFVAGTLDMLTAILVYSVIMHRVTAMQILHSIAGGAFGKNTVGSETTMALIGLAFHYLIAYSFAIGYFIVYPYIPFLQKQKIVSGLLYGVFVWAVMNLIVVPLSNANYGPIKWDSALRAAAILMLCIGLPISLITSKYYAVKNKH